LAMHAALLIDLGIGRLTGEDVAEGFGACDAVDVFLFAGSPT